MAERSKAPDSRSNPSHGSWDWAFWSPNGGVGSNPTSDIYPSFFFYFSLCNQFLTLFSSQNFVVKTYTLYITCKKKKKNELITYHANHVVRVCFFSGQARVRD